MKTVGRFLLLGVLLLALAIPASAATLVYEDVFSFEYPDGWEDYGADPSGDIPGEYYEAAFVGGRRFDDLNVLVEIYYYEPFADVRLFDLEEELLQDYRESLECTFYEVKSGELIYAGEHRIPFALIHGIDSAGECFYAETVSNGWVISFWAYAYEDLRCTRERELTGEDMKTFRDLIGSFEPVTGGGAR